MRVALQEHTFDTGVVTLNYAQGPPAGPPFVLFHGGVRPLAPRESVSQGG